MISIEVRRAQRAAVMRRWRLTEKGRACNRRYQNSDKRRIVAARYQRKSREEAIDIHGGRCQCPCGCQDARRELLEFAHVNGDGKQHRQELGGPSAYALTLWVKRNPTSDRVRLLCPSCHTSWDKIHKCDGLTSIE